MIYCFIWHAFCFILLLACFWFIFVCFHVCSCASCLSSCFILYAMFRSFFLMCWCFGLRAHMLDIMSTVMLCLVRSTCLYVCSTLLCLCPCRSHAFMLTSTCLYVHSHAYMHISMLICVDWCIYMLRSMRSTGFMPFLMCLRALRLVYVLRPRPCLLCHVLL